MVLDFDIPIIGERDFERLFFLDSIRNLSREYPYILGDQLERARIIPHRKVPRSVVTMNSVVNLQDPESRDVRTVVLVYPFRADPKDGRISVDSPLGSELLGAQIGQVINWVSAEGHEKRFKIVSIPYQPEAAGTTD